MNGSVALAFAGCVDVVGVLLVVAGATVLAGDFVDFDGDVPLPGSFCVGFGGGVA
ncbi:MAG TPA: hypothetical protein VFC30_02470 [Solirubrobacteraceae bacterium]|nr:hypothetical protein [Solirubrobacteraceae bacterium]